MRKRALHTILLLVFLVASGSGQSAKECSEDPFLKCPNDKLPSFALWDQGGQHVVKAPICRLATANTFFFIAGMTIDADGAPNAYNPDDTGLDELANAGWPNQRNVIVTDRHGNPVVQQEGDPFPGHYISCTSLADKSKEFTDPARYVDATKVPYVALPQEIAQKAGTQLGDFAFVLNLRNGKSSFAIYADIGSLGEGSVALAERLGISANARHGGESDGVLYMFFPGSGNMKPRTIVEIESEGERLLSDSGKSRDARKMVMAQQLAAENFSSGPDDSICE
jgi:hypothetical protein